MGFFELFLIGIGLSMDAFAVAICKGLGMERINKRDTLLLALFFGGFQALMPLTGYLLGSRFASYIERWDHWIAFVLLAFIGGNMIRESREQEEEEIEHGGSIRYRELFTWRSPRARRAGRRRLVRLPRRAHRARRHAHRLHDLCAHARGRLGRQSLRLALQEPRRADRRYHSHPHRREDFARASGRFRIGSPYIDKKGLRVSAVLFV